MAHTIISEKQLPESELELGVEIAYETLLPHRATALKKISAGVSLPGFRPGHAPEHLIVQKVGELAILEEAAYETIEKVLPAILAEKKISIVGEPRVSITKLAKDNPLTFTVTVSVLPEVKLPDYKKIAVAENTKKPEEIAVSEKEVSELIETIRKNYAQATAPKGEVAPPTPEEAGKHLPELTDDFVKKLGDFTNVADFKAKVAENLRAEKEHKTREKKRLTIAEAVLKKTDVTVPKALIESESAKLFARFHDDIARMGLNIEDYLKQSKKTEEDLRKDWRPDAEKRGKLHLVWSAIAEAEKLSPPEGTVEAEVKHILEHHRGADPARAKAYVAMMLTNEKVFEFLEKQK